MKDVNAMLRRIDEEITFNRQEIARRQVDNARLEDTRRVLMGLQEADEAAKADRAAAGGTLLNGSHAKPVLIVRKTGSGGGEKRRGGNRRPPKGEQSVSAQMRERILAFINVGDEPIASADLANNLGLPKGEENRKGMNNALYQLRVGGALKRDAQKRYYRPEPPPVPS